MEETIYTVKVELEKELYDILVVIAEEQGVTLSMAARAVIFYTFDTILDIETSWDYEKSNQD